MFAYKSLYENSREVCNVHGLARHVWRPKINNHSENLLSLNAELQCRARLTNVVVVVVRENVKGDRMHTDLPCR